MAVVHELPRTQSWLARVLATDFCPWANRFVYWLKEPVGWFVLAIAIGCIVGLYFDPVGWTVAGAIALMVTVGMIWPLIATCAVKIEIHPEQSGVHEDADCDMIVRVCNRLPIPLWGLVVEGFLHVANQEGDQGDEPTAALASVPAWCRGNYKIKVCPQIRGHYPIQKPNVACSFPFAIWTARKQILDSFPLTVWPKVYPVAGESHFSDKARAEHGMGQRKGRDGDFTGIRPYRTGDSIKQVHWVATARTDSLMVTERGDPQTAILEVWIDTQVGRGGRGELDRRMRIAASLLASLSQQQIPFRLQVGDQSLGRTRGDSGMRRSLDLLADVPREGDACRRWHRGQSTAWIAVTASERESAVQACNPSGVLRMGHKVRHWQIAGTVDLATILSHFWREGNRDELAA